MNRVIKWATDILHAAGGDPWSGMPNKVEASAGKVVTGRLPKEEPPAEETNWWRWLCATLVSAACSLQILNWTRADVTFTNPNYRPIEGLWDPTTNTAWLLEEGLPDVAFCESSIGGLTWAAYAAPNINGPRDAADDGAGTKAAVGSTWGDQIRFKTGAGVWTLWAGLPGPGKTFISIEHDGAGLWVAVDSTGAVYSSTGPAVPFAPVATPPGFGAIGTWARVMHSRHYAGEVDQYDPGNPIWIIVAPAGGPVPVFSTSTDGATWTAAAPLALPAGAFAYDRWAYSAAMRRWVAADMNANVYVSADNGTSWSAPVAIAVGFATPVTPSTIDVSCDRGSDVVLVICDGATNYEVWVSDDAGETFSRVWLPSGGAAFQPEYVVTWYGGGQFFIAINSTTGGVKPQIAYSLRMK